MDFHPAGLLIVVLPPRYFVDDHQFFAGKPRPVRWLAVIAKNLLGLVIVAIGVFLSIPGIPGQGLLTILIGVILLDIPGKRRLVRLLIERPWIGQSVNRLRARFGRPPLEFEP